MSRSYRQVGGHKVLWHKAVGRKRKKRQHKEVEQILTELPFQIFMLVSSVDRKIDAEERLKFRKLLRNRTICESRYTRRLFHKADVMYDILYDRFAVGHSEASVDQVHQAMEYINLCLPPYQAQLVANDLSRLAFGVAGASGGIWGLASISDEESEVITQLKQIFKKYM